MWQIIRVMYDKYGNETDRRVLLTDLYESEAGNILFELSRFAEPLGNLLQDYLKLTGERPGYITDDILTNYYREPMQSDGHTTPDA